jgi:glycerol-3-phosphate cytidylyltransferase
MKTIITYGTFDLFHIGHVKILERARAMGDRLIVGVSSNEFNKIKGKKSIFPYEHRAAIVSAIKYVDEVFPEHHWDQKPDDIKKYGASVLVMGHDWAGKFDSFNTLCEVHYLSRTQGISTTELKQALRSFDGERLKELIAGIEALQSIATQLSDNGSQPNEPQSEPKA